MQIRCECGKVLKVPDNLAGKMVRCPACKRTFKAQAPASEQATKVTMECPSCGKRLSAPVSAAGKVVRCPACNGELNVPSPGGAAEPSGPRDALEMGETPEQEEEYGVAGITCPNCGATLEAGSQFCIECGTHLSTGMRMQAVDVSELKQKRQQRRKTQVLVGGVVVGLLVLGGATYGVVKYLQGRSAARTAVQPPSSRPIATPPAAGPAARPAPAPRTAAVSKPKPAEKPKLGPPPLKKGKDEGYLENVVYAPGRVRAKVDTLAANEAVKAFQAEKGRLPRDIAELEAAGYKLPPLQTGLEYDYDPKTGEISVWRVKDRMSAE